MRMWMRMRRASGRRGVRTVHDEAGLGEGVDEVEDDDVRRGDDVAHVLGPELQSTRAQANRTRSFMNQAVERGGFGRGDGANPLVPAADVVNVNVVAEVAGRDRRPTGAVLANGPPPPAQCSSSRS